MEHIVLIWEKNKTKNIHTIRARVTLTESDIKELALSKFREQYTEKADYIYTAYIDKTII